jgi:hypothetical protein
MMVRKQAVVDRIEGRLAVLSLEGGDQIRVPKEDLGEDAVEGAVFVLQLLPDREAGLERETLARSLLNQLLEHEPKKESRIPGQGPEAS